MGATAVGLRVRGSLMDSSGRPAGRDPGRGRPEHGTGGPGRVRGSAPGPRRSSRSEGADRVGLHALLALAGGEAHALVLVKGAVAARLDRGVVDEDVLASVIGGDEAEALLGVEPLHGAV